MGVEDTGGRTVWAYVHSLRVDCPKDANPPGGGEEVHFEQLIIY